MPKYRTPRLEYVQSPDRPTLEQLAAKWHKRDGDGCSLDHLKALSTKEGWVAERDEHWERLHEASLETQVIATEEAARKAVAQYEADLAEWIEYVRSEARKFMRIGAGFRNMKEALDCGIKIIELDRKVRGLDVQKVEHQVPDAWRELFTQLGMRKPGNGDGRDVKSPQTRH